MLRDEEKYLYFTVGLLENSSTLEALKADAMKHHMSKNPAQLIALRLTEYYDLLARNGLPAFPELLAASTSSEMGGSSGSNSGVKREVQFVDGFNEVPIASPERDEGIITVSADAEQNADLAADYWATL